MVATSNCSDLVASNPLLAAHTMLASRDEEGAGTPSREEHMSTTFPSKGTEWKDAEEGNRVMEEPKWRDEV